MAEELRKHRSCPSSKSEEGGSCCYIFFLSVSNDLVLNDSLKLQFHLYVLTTSLLTFRELLRVSVDLCFLTTTSL